MKELNRKKFLTWFFTLGMIGIALLCVFLVLNEKRTTKLDPGFIEELNVVTPSEEMRVHIDSFETWNTWKPGIGVSVNGWVALTSKEAKKVSIYVVLRDTADGAYYQLPTAVIERPDVTAYLNDPSESPNGTPTNYNYSHSGFRVDSGEWNSLNSKGNQYDLYILYEINNTAYLIDAQVSSKGTGE